MPWSDREEALYYAKELLRWKVITEERYNIIKSKIYNIWQDNDALQAEVITSTSL